MLFLILVLTRWPFPDCRYFLRKMFRRKQVLGPGGFEHISDTEFLRERFNIELGSGYDGVDDDKDVDDLYLWIVTGGTRHPKCVSIVSILDEVLELSSQQKPKRLNFLGSDGHSYSFLLKKGDDLNLDSRIGETFELFDYLLQQEKESRDENMTLRSYNVVPIVPKNTRTCASTCGCAECARTRTHAHAKILKHAHAHARAREYFFKMRTRTHAHAIENFAHVRARARFIKLSFFGQLGHFSTSLFWLSIELKVLKT